MTMKFEIHQPEVHTRPLVDADRWEAVMEAAWYRCQCAGGLCGSQHSNSGLRCKAEHDRGHVRLIAAPLDLGLSDVAAAAVPIHELRAWCQNCYTLARRRARAAYAAARHSETGPADTLF